MRGKKKIRLAYQRTSEKRPWEEHPTGCAASGWKDGFDATRCAVFPHILARRSRSRSDGDVVAVFATSSQVLAAGAKNPVALCLMGDLFLDSVEKSPRAVISSTPFRLEQALGGADRSKSLVTRSLPESSAENCAAALGLDQEGAMLWKPYIRNTGEFSVPRTRDECEQVLAGVQTGRVPVFDAAQGGGTPPTSSMVKDSPTGDQACKAATARARSDHERQAGNALFRQKDWNGALARYDEARSLDPTNVAALSNRTAALLRLGRHPEALIAANEVLATDPVHEKALYRRAQARLGISDFAGAADDCRALIDRVSNAKTRAAAETLLSKARAASDAALAEAEAHRTQTTHAMTAHTLSDATGGSGTSASSAGAQHEPPPTDAELPKLLAAAVGWQRALRPGGMPGWCVLSLSFSLFLFLMEALFLIL
jgi:tetratricopeptide (TPR) repeat protein